MRGKGGMRHKKVKKSFNDVSILKNLIQNR